MDIVRVGQERDVEDRVAARKTVAPAPLSREAAVQDSQPDEPGRLRVGEACHPEQVALHGALVPLSQQPILELCESCADPGIPLLRSNGLEPDACRAPHEASEICEGRHLGVVHGQRHSLRL